MILSKCAIFCRKKSRFIKKNKKQAEYYAICNLGLKTPLYKMPLLGDVVFYNYKNE